MADMKLLIKSEALALFAKKGYEGTSVREIARKVGLTPAALYSHFASKENLYLEILDSCIYNFVKGVENIFNNHNDEDKERLLYRIFIYFIQFYMNENPDSVFIQRNTMFPSDGLQDIIIGKFMYSTKEMHGRIINTFDECTSLKKVPDMDYIVIFFRFIDGFVMEVVARKKFYTIDELNINWEIYWRLIQQL